MMLVPPWEPVKGVYASAAAVMRERGRGLRGLRGSYRGITARAAEFIISYGFTGLVSGWIGKLAVSAPTAAAAWAAGAFSYQRIMVQCHEHCSDGAAVAVEVVELADPTFAA